MLCSGLALQGGAQGFFPDPELLPGIEAHGFIESRAGVRTQKDPCEKDISVMEIRLQGEFFMDTDSVEFKYKGDVWHDGVKEQREYDTREAWFFARPLDFLDVKIGRQILTWGTGDLVFLNDLFPKDWQSYFIGRDREYLKAPSDAAKISLFSEIVNLDLVYTPVFDPDRYITGAYVSYWNESLKRRAGQDAPVIAHTPDCWFQDDELAIRLYRNMGSHELAFYGYRGFWKSPGGKSLTGTASFPELNVYGASIRGPVGSGIANLEAAFYQSADDKKGSDPGIRNSEMRYLVGYTQDMARDLNFSLQYYMEQMLDYSRYRANLSDGPFRDRLRQVITLQVTSLLMDQKLELSLSSCYSPGDQDAFFRYTMRHTCTDRIMLEAGTHIFVGEKSHTFFGQFEKNTSIYSAIRYSF
jgi:hypothetical protein